MLDIELPDFVPPPLAQTIAKKPQNASQREKKKVKTTTAARWWGGEKKMVPTLAPGMEILKDLYSSWDAV